MPDVWLQVCARCLMNTTGPPLPACPACHTNWVTHPPGLWPFVISAYDEAFLTSFHIAIR